LGADHNHVDAIVKVLPARLNRIFLFCLLSFKNSSEQSKIRSEMPLMLAKEQHDTVCLPGHCDGIHANNYLLASLTPVSFKGCAG